MAQIAQRYIWHFCRVFDWSEILVSFLELFYLMIYSATVFMG